MDQQVFTELQFGTGSIKCPTLDMLKMEKIRGLLAPSLQKQALTDEEIEEFFNYIPSYHGTQGEDALRTIMNNLCEEVDLILLTNHEELVAAGADLTGVSLEEAFFQRDTYLPADPASAALAISQANGVKLQLPTNEGEDSAQEVKQADQAEVQVEEQQTEVEPEGGQEVEETLHPVPVLAENSPQMVGQSLGLLTTLTNLAVAQLDAMKAIQQQNEETSQRVDGIDERLSALEARVAPAQQQEEVEDAQVV